MILSMFADQPYSPVTKMHGESTSWSETTTSHAVAEDVLHRSAQVFKLRLGFFERRFLFLGLLELQAFFGAADQLFAVVLFQLLDGVLVDRVAHVQDFVAALLELLDERRGFDRVQVFRR